MLKQDVNVLMICSKIYVRGIPRELNNMGSPTVQVNDSMARYTTLLGRTGKLQGMSNKAVNKRTQIT